MHVPRTCTPTLNLSLILESNCECATSIKRIMATLIKLATACCRSSQGERLNGHMLAAARLLHKSSETFGISAAGGEAAAEPLIATVKSLKEMPGPSTLSNLVEFFWRDGFSRIHEIQV